MIPIGLGVWSIRTMWQTHVVSSGVGLVLLILGALQPQMILLDMPFGLAFYVADRLGIWKLGILWAVDHRLIAIGCWLIWPFLVSLSLGYVLVIVTIRLWRWSPLYALLFTVLVAGLIFAIRVQPGSYFISYFGYWTANY